MVVFSDVAKGLFAKRFCNTIRKKSSNGALNLHILSKISQVRPKYLKKKDLLVELFFKMCYYSDHQAGFCF